MRDGSFYLKGKPRCPAPCPGLWTLPVPQPSSCEKERLGECSLAREGRPETPSLPGSLPSLPRALWGRVLAGTPSWPRAWEGLGGGSVTWRVLIFPGLVWQVQPGGKFSTIWLHLAATFLPPRTSPHSRSPFHLFLSSIEKVGWLSGALLFVIPAQASQSGEIALCSRCPVGSGGWVPSPSRGGLEEGAAAGEKGLQVCLPLHWRGCTEAICSCWRCEPVSPGLPIPTLFSLVPRG